MPAAWSTFSATLLRRFGTAVLEAMGTPTDLAAIVAESLVEGNLAGHDSHGIMRLRVYSTTHRAGKVNPAMRASVLSRHMGTAIVDGGYGWGQPAARLATETVLMLAADHGVGAVTVRHCNHIGRLGEYVEIMARAGMMGIALCNTTMSVVPFGGRERRLGTNPFAWAAPTADPAQPFVLDFATAAVAVGKLQVAQAKGEEVAPGQILDRQGQPSTRPADYMAGGAVLPFGGHKGYALSTMIELMGGVLSGASASCLPEYDGSNGTLLYALNIAAFQPLGSFIDQSERVKDALKTAQPVAGVAEILVPGEPEAMARNHRREAGIPLPAQTVEDLDALARDLGVESLSSMV